MRTGDSRRHGHVLERHWLTCMCPQDQVDVPQPCWTLRNVETLNVEPGCVMTGLSSVYSIPPHRDWSSWVGRRAGIGIGI
jgi:hypothetical protein